LFIFVLSVACLEIWLFKLVVNVFTSFTSKVFKSVIRWDNVFNEVLIPVKSLVKPVIFCLDIVSFNIELFVIGN
jgi:hypothetical protein